MYLLVISSCLLQWSGAFTPVAHNANIPPSSQCGQSNPFEDDQQLMEKLKMIHQQLPPPGCNPPPTCRDILRCNSSASSGYYQIQAANGSAVQVYCDMEGTNCGGEGGWMRVTRLNMTEPSNQCPDDLLLATSGDKRFCVRDIAKNGLGCTPFPTESYGLVYSQVCGFTRGYQQGSPDAFVSSQGFIANGLTISYGNLHTHIWTYVAGIQETNSYPASPTTHNCPCKTIPGVSPPPQVGNDYYCESGSPNQPGLTTWYPDDPLWDGKQCGGLEGPCCTHTGMPWFIKRLSTHTSARINAELCTDEPKTDEDIGIERLELYIR